MLAVSLMQAWLAAALRILTISSAVFWVSVAGAETAVYRLNVTNTWSEQTHPGAFPEDAHFSWLGGATHTAAISFWAEGALASPGIVRMAETGATDVLVQEVEAAVAQGSAGGALDWRHWFCPEAITNPNCGSLVVEFEIDSSFPLVSLATMLGPSPDWFVGVAALALHDGAAWTDEVVIDLRPYDGGTRDANAFELGGPQTDPPDPVSRITAQSGQRIGPDSLGSLRFERVPPVPSIGRGGWAMGAALLILCSVGFRRRAGASQRLDAGTESPNL